MASETPEADHLAGAFRFIEANVRALDGAFGCPFRYHSNPGPAQPKSITSTPCFGTDWR